MSFGEHVIDALDPERTLWHRMSAVKGCVASLSRLTGLPFRATLERLGLTWSIANPSPAPPTEAFLLDVLARVRRERARYLAALAPFEAARRARKAAGNRQMSSAERRALAALRDAIDLDRAEADAPDA